MIELTNISVRYGSNVVVRQVTATVQTGEFIALVGPNGSGKSSLIKAIANLIPHEGVTSLPQQARDRARHIAYLAQHSTAPDNRHVEDIIALGRTPFLGPFLRLSEADRDAIEVAATACGTTEFFGRTYGSLSGGEQMRVHLSRALATQAPILLVDEPITALDPYYQITVMNILRDVARSGTTIIAALHDLALVKKFADKVWVMDRGDLVADAPAHLALTPKILGDVFRITKDGEIA